MVSEFDSKWGKRTPGHDPHALAGFRARLTDVLIATAPKAGTTWTQQILHQLATGGDPEVDNIFEVVPWLEMPVPGKSTEEVLAGYETMRDPRLFKTHCTRQQMPGVHTAKLVVVSRDPRDSVVSFHHHLQGLTDEARRIFDGFEVPKTLDAVVDRWVEAKLWSRNVGSWWPHRDDANVLWLRYEDMKRDLPAAFDRLVDFLGWSVSAEGRRRALEYSSFEWMKKHRRAFVRMPQSEKELFEPGSFIRRGETGSHETELTRGQIDRVMREARESLEPECLEFLGLNS